MQSFGEPAPAPTDAAKPTVQTVDIDYQAKRPSLRDTVANRMFRAKCDARLASHLAELVELLDKHPDVGRILDLVEEMRG